MVSTERTIADVAKAVKDAKRRERPCVILLGAGCSASARIPLASRFVEIVEERYPTAFQRARQKTYPYVMGELDSGPRYELVHHFVSQAGLNWAHLSLGWLLKQQFIGRVLTTNFDNLVQRACAFYGVHPSVYDLALSPERFDASLIQDPSLFFLHGQGSGLIQLHTLEETAENAEKLKPAFDDSSTGRPWIVVGYSGDNDPVFENLAQVNHFTNGLYWVGYKDNEPSRHVRERLLGRDRQAYLVRGYDADEFFIALQRELEEAPLFLEDPFAHLLEVMQDFTPFPTRDDEEIDPTTASRELIRQAQAELVEGEERQTRDETEDRAAQIQRLYVAGKYEEAIRLAGEASLDPESPLAEPVALSLFALGVQLFHKAEEQEGDVASRLLEEALAKFEAVLSIQPNDHASLDNIGNIQLRQSKGLPEDEALELLARAMENYRRALELKPDNPISLNNISNALAELARFKSGTEAQELLAQARQHLERALVLEPDYRYALGTLGSVLTDQAAELDGDQAKELLVRARGLLEKALDIKPDYLFALEILPVVLLRLATGEEGDEAARLLDQSLERMRQGLELSPRQPSLLFNMACLQAQLGHVEQAVEWLERRTEVLPTLTLQDVRDDSDFDGIRDDPAFAAFVETLP